MATVDVEFEGVILQQDVIECKDPIPGFTIGIPPPPPCPLGLQLYHRTQEQVGNKDRESV